jgi:hypothetical protein
MTFPIPEPGWLNGREFYSRGHYGGYGLTYEVGMCISNGHLVWFNGPFPASMTGLQIFRQNLAGLLAPSEKVRADLCYQGHPRILTPFDDEEKPHKMVMRRRIEMFSRRIKDWGALFKKFRHSLFNHHIVFEAVLAIVQIETENGQPAYDEPKYEEYLAIE